eukprot:CAMPEP_0185708882 /NCGR_PEP_ID=MMETSP1164-20130828/27478_1 /TAXON_ID=1104430 /ORGANISM="Chrysoreinhardia sp, Strain CCMP2950" /LENGTH=105 /DNA_ID=CAMNT_0028376349 /DNA_START=209 /DNA_END=524 /DNA_ORIENTATION=+
MRRRRRRRRRRGRRGGSTSGDDALAGRDGSFGGTVMVVSTDVYVPVGRRLAVRPDAEVEVVDDVVGAAVVLERAQDGRDGAVARVEHDRDDGLARDVAAADVVGR